MEVDKKEADLETGGISTLKVQTTKQLSLQQAADSLFDAELNDDDDWDEEEPTRVEFSMNTPSLDSESSLSSMISFDFVHGVQFTQPKANFIEGECIKEIKEIHDLLRDRDSRLFFVAEVDLKRQSTLYGFNSVFTETSIYNSPLPINEDIPSNSVSAKGTVSNVLSSVFSSPVGKKRSSNQFDSSFPSLPTVEDGKHHETNSDDIDKATNNTVVRNQQRDSAGIILQSENNNDSNNNHNNDDKDEGELNDDNNTDKDENGQGSTTTPSLTFALNEGLVKFNFTVFIRELLYNLFFPLLLPLIFVFENDTGARSRMYWGSNFGLYYPILNLINLIALWSMIGLFFSFGMDSSMRRKFTVYFLGTLIFHLIKSTTIAIKWGYAPSGIFSLMRKQVLTQEQFGMIHLLVGWINVHPTSLAREMGQAMARMEVDMNSLEFEFRCDFSNSRRDTDQRLGALEQRKVLSGVNSDAEISVQSHAPLKTYGNLLLPYLVYISSEKIHDQVEYIKRFAAISVFFIALIPVIHAFIAADTTDWSVDLFVFLLFWNIGQNLYPPVMFGWTIAMDFERRYRFVTFTTRLIQPFRDAFSSVLARNTYKSHLFPNEWLAKNPALLRGECQTLNLTDFTTIYNWSLLRQFCLDFGLQFLRREEGDLAVILIGTLFLLSLYISSALVHTEPIFRNSSAQDELRNFRPHPLATVFVFGIAALTLIPAFLSLSYADSLNSKLSKQRSLLSAALIKLKHEQMETEFESVEDAMHLNDDDNDNDENEDENENNHYFNWSNRRNAAMKSGGKGKKRRSGVILAGHSYCASAEDISDAAQVLDKLIVMLDHDRFGIQLLGYSVNATFTSVLATILGSAGFALARFILGDSALS